MSASPSHDLLRPGVLHDVRLVTAHGAEHVAARCAALGATTTPLAADLADEDASLAAAARLDRPGVLVCDAGARFAQAGGGLDGLRAAVDESWIAVRAVASTHWTHEHGDGGRIVLLAPAPDAGAHAGAVTAALENLARTLSIEWSRFGVTTVAIVPAEGSGAGAVAELTAYLASPAGGYFSGCVVRLSS